MTMMFKKAYSERTVYKKAGAFHELQKSYRWLCDGDPRAVCQLGPLSKLHSEQSGSSKQTPTAGICISSLSCIWSGYSGCLPIIPQTDVGLVCEIELRLVTRACNVCRCQRPAAGRCRKSQAIHAWQWRPDVRQSASLVTRKPAIFMTGKRHSWWPPWPKHGTLFGCSTCAT